MRLIRAVALSVTVVLSFQVAGAQGPTDGEWARVADDVRGIRRALDRLVALKQAEEHHRTIDLMLKRIELSVARLEPLERMLRSAKGTVERLENSLRNLERMREQQQVRLDQEIRGGTDAPHSDTRRQLQNIERSELAQNERLEAAQLKIVQLENDLMDDRREVEILDDMLLELLEEER